MLFGLRALRASAKLATVQRFARNILDLSDASSATVRYSPVEAHSVDLVHCAAAQLLDLSIGRAEHTAICGTARAADVTRAMRLGFSAEIIGLMQRDAQWKISLLRRYLTDKDPAVRVRAVDALGGVAGPEVELPLSRALEDKDLGVLGAAAEVVAKRAGQLTSREISSVLRRRLASLSPMTAPDTTCAVVRALGKLGAQLPTSLMRSAARAVRQCALAVLRQKDPTIKLGAQQLSRALPDLRWAGDRPPPERAVLVTDKGEIHIELFADETPATVASFARLAGKRFFRGTRFHRLIPGFVLQGGDPSFTGWGGPGFTIPCELTPRPYTRGSIGMALAGRDTGGSQFFIALARHPHLDGRYTQFGRVVKGMDVVDRLAVGDRIKDLYIP
jgi:cyclophilin family peptidyl-prolyl cis-trans isomerase